MTRVICNAAVRECFAAQGCSNLRVQRRATTRTIQPPSRRQGISLLSRVLQSCSNAVSATYLAAVLPVAPLAFGIVCLLSDALEAVQYFGVSQPITLCSFDELGDAH